MLTASNLVLGMISIMYTISGNFFMAGVFILLAMVADGLDGRAARFFKVSSEFGKELDSLCDLVSFGVAPAVLAYEFMLKDIGVFGAVAAIMFATCGALRLARFNVNTGVVHGFFMGLPIPAGGCVVATFIMLGIRPDETLFALLVMLYGYLMVSRVRYPDFKGKDGEPIRTIPAVLACVLAAAVLVWLFQSDRLYGVLFIPYFCYSVFGIMNTAFGLFSSK
jgi:CDP-diacylglycerol--serine O-phosphatidyltransferase